MGLLQKLRNRINNQKRTEEHRYKSEKVTRNLDSPEQLWKTIKNIMGWQSNGPPQQIIDQGSIITKPYQIATLMNKYFPEKVCKIRKSLPKTDPNYDVCEKIMSNKNCRLSLEHVTLSKVKKLIKSLTNSKSSSVDGLDNFSLKLAADYVALPLHHIITLSIMQRCFPTSWKCAKVVPIHKKGSLLERNNYRPVALLSPLGKIMEKAIYEQLYKYFTMNKIFHKNLHGYRQNRSTQTALLQIYDKFIKAANKKQISGAVLLDLSAAFDLVDHGILSRKLEAYGVDSEFRDWIETYLKGRLQAVWISNCYSDFLECEVGVPQGSNRGPLFFLIFYNDLPYSVDCDLEAYADDSTLIYSSHNTEDIEEFLSTSCEKVIRWMNQNSLKLNTEKTDLLLLGTSNRLATIESNFEIDMGGTLVVEHAEKCGKLLGVHIQSNLKWHKHLNQLKQKLKSRLAGLRKLQFVVPGSALKTIAQGIFDSSLVYCLPLFGGCERADLNSLQVLQNKVAQIVLKFPPRSNRILMYDKLDWLTINQLIDYHTLLSIFRIRSCKEPEYLAAIFSNENANGRVILPKPNLELAEKSFCIRGAKLWNSLPRSLKTENKMTPFKLGLKKWVKAHIQRFLD